MTLSMQRRDAIKALIAISAANALAACGARSETSEKADAKPKAMPKMSAEELAFLSAVAQTIIPKTETAGAIEAGVPDTLKNLFDTWGDDTLRIYWREGLASLSSTLSAKNGGQDFASISAAQQANLLGRFDADVYSGNIEDDFYKDMKSTIGRAYYMSEPGATEELEYDPVPGDFKGCIPFADVGKAWAPNG